MRKLKPSVDKDLVEPKPSEQVRMLPLMFDEKAAAEYAGISLSYLRKSRSDGSPGGRTPAPPFVKIGKRCLYRKSDLDSWVLGLQAHRVVGDNIEVSK